MTEENFSKLVGLHRESVRLCQEILQTLADERLTLISLETDKLSAVLLHKENLVHALQSCRGNIYHFLTSEQGLDSAEALELVLSPEQLSEWKKCKEEWNSIWAKTCVLGEQNQRFLKHSLKNLGKFADHLKQLMGEPSRYSSKGDKVDSSPEGRMLEASC